GPGFFGVVTEYTLRAYRAPEAITSSSYYYPLERIEEVGEWAGRLARRLPREIELSIAIAGPPPSIVDRCGAGFVCVVVGAAFADTPTAAASMLKVMDTCPVLGTCIHKELNLATSINALGDLMSMMMPERHRYFSDTLWTNSAPGEVLALSREHFLRAPSLKSSQYFVFSTGERLPFPDAAYSMWGDALLLCYAIWE